jgi:mono/diheme cytochrome c family protein
VAELFARRRAFVRRTAVAAVCGSALLIGAAARPTAVASAAAAPALYSAAQAAAGGKTYTASCAQCHGENLEGGVGPALRGPNLVQLAKKTHLTVGDFFQFMALQMPLNAPASLPKNGYAAVMAYILKRNGFPAGPKPLGYDAAMKSTTIITTYPGH